MGPDEEYRENLPEIERSVEDELILRDYIRIDNEIVEPDTFATESHDATVERARKHRKALKKAKHDVCMLIQRKQNWDEALREKGFGSFPYSKGEERIPLDRLYLKEILARDVARDWDEARREKGFKAYPYAADTFDKVDKPIKMGKLESQALADMKKQVSELETVNDELPSIWDENVEEATEIEIDPDDFEFSICPAKVWYEKGREE